MWFDDLIQNNQSAVLTLIGTISGAIIVLVGNLAYRWLEHKNMIKLKRLDLVIDIEKKYLIEPVVSFIDDDLKLMQEIYDTLVTNKPIPSLNNKHIFKLSSIQARIQGLGDGVLCEKFEEFSRVRLSVGNAVSNGNWDGAQNNLNKAITLAGKILELLFKKLNEIHQ